MKKMLVVPPLMFSVTEFFNRCVRPLKAWAKLRSVTPLVVWPSTQLVGKAEYAELFAPIDGVEIFSLRTSEIEKLSYSMDNFDSVVIEGEEFDVKTELSMGDSANVCLNWKFDFSHLTLPPLKLQPCTRIQETVAALTKGLKLNERVGIYLETVGKTDEFVQNALVDVVRLPKDTPVFIVTDDKGVQDHLCKYFATKSVLQKSFDQVPATQSDMVVGVTEMFSVAACKHVYCNKDFVLSDDLESKHVFLE